MSIASTNVRCLTSFVAVPFGTLPDVCDAGAWLICACATTTLVTISHSDATSDRMLITCQSGMHNTSAKPGNDLPKGCSPGSDIVHWTLVWGVRIYTSFVMKYFASGVPAYFFCGVQKMEPCWSDWIRPRAWCCSLVSGNPRCPPDPRACSHLSRMARIPRAPQSLVTGSLDAVGVPVSCI